MAQYKLTTDGKGECFLHDPVTPGERVEFDIVYRGVGDEGIPTGVKDSYGIVVWYNLIEVTDDRMRKPIFDYDSADIVVNDGVIKASFVVPKGVSVLTVKWLCSMTGGTLFREGSDLDWATNYGKAGDKTQKIQIKMLVATGDTPQTE